MASTVGTVCVTTITISPYKIGVLGRISSKGDGAGKGGGGGGGGGEGRGEGRAGEASPPNSSTSLPDQPNFNPKHSRKIV